MRIKILILGLIFLFLVACGEEDSLESPFSPSLKRAVIVLDGPLFRTYTSYGTPQFTGYVKNTGTGTGYNCMVDIACYSDSNKITIIDNAKGFPADLGDIGVGQRAFFKAVAFECSSHSQILSYSVDITWLNK